jgi:hypothetical protein
MCRGDVVVAASAASSALVDLLVPAKQQVHSAGQAGSVVPLGERQLGADASAYR